MMRELDVSPVVWPAWCYTGEGQGDSEPAVMSDVPQPQSATKSRAKSRQVPTMPPTEHNNNNNNNSTSNNNTSSALKTERLSPTTTTVTSHVDNNSTSSRSATPGSFPGTPPGQSPGSSPSIVNRNYSDMMRSLAAKYNNTNPNDYFSGPTRNGSTFPVTLDPRFTAFKGGATPFAGLMAPLATTVMPTSHMKSTNATATSATPKDTDSANLHKKSLDAQALYAAAASSFNNHFNANASAMFPPLIDMSSSQALLNMVRTASAHNASQLETYLKGAIKRPPPSESSPLDLSSAGGPTMKKQRKSFSENNFFSNDSFLNIPIVDTLRTKAKRTGSVSPLSRGGGSNGSSPRLANASMTSTSAGGGASVIGGRCVSLCRDAQAIAHWTVDDVCSYVTSIESCAEYAQNFRAERIDGTSLPLLTEEHLTNAMNMKLGPVLKLRATLARRLGNCTVCSHCLHCHTSSEPSAVSATQRPSSADN